MMTGSGEMGNPTELGAWTDAQHSRKARASGQSNRPRYFPTNAAAKLSNLQGGNASISPRAASRDSAPSRANSGYGAARWG
eukprot:10406351-Alexandrium_andersonii.AAC.1